MSSKVIIRAADSGSQTFRQLVWRKIKIRKSLDEVCHYMELTLPASERDKIKKHDRVVVWYQNPLLAESHLVTTVMVDEVANVADTSQRVLVVIGRSPARDIIDSKWYGWPRCQTPLEDIVNDIAAPFFEAIGVKKPWKSDDPRNNSKPWATIMPTNDEPTKPVFEIAWDAESPWTKLINEADKQGLILTSNGAGNLYLWRVPGYIPEWLFLEEGKNIRDVKYVQNGAEQYHEYVVRAAWKEARVTDSSCRNARKLYINLSDPSIADTVLERRAKTEMRRRSENRTTVTATGWGLSDPQIRALGNTHQKEVIWSPNFLIPVKIPSLGLDDNLLVSQVEHTATESVMTSDITLVKKEAYQ